MKLALTIAFCGTLAALTTAAPAPCFQKPSVLINVKATILGVSVKLAHTNCKVPGQLLDETTDAGKYLAAVRHDSESCFSKDKCIAACRTNLVGAEMSDAFDSEAFSIFLGKERTRCEKDYHGTYSQTLFADGKSLLGLL